MITVEQALSGLSLQVEAIQRQLVVRPTLDPLALWDTEMIGSYAGVSASQAAKWAKRPGFPPVIILPSGGRRWKGREVIAWVERRN